MNVTEACGICFKEQIKVYPVKVGGTWRIEVKTGNNKPIRYKKPLKEGSDTSNAMAKTYIFLAKKIIKAKNLTLM
jgi:hypothetical protein|tara:strand:- start:6001 stop:6225 length:225 start_codon:yes stop_codon:yes gene_type:complete